jgi:CheY-like chemotaxis protein
MYVLYVEDDAALVRIATRKLAQADIRVEAATTLHAAIERVTQAPPNTFAAAIVDLQLPDGSGLGLLPFLRERGIPAVIASAYVDPENPPSDEHDVLWVSKPFHADVLAVVLRSVARAKARRRRRTPSEFGDKHGLSARELEVVILADRQVHGRAAANEMGCGLATYRSYCARVIRKIGVLRLRDARSQLRAFLDGSDR